MSLISKEILDVPRPKCTQIRLFGKKYYVVPYTSVWSKSKKRSIKKTLPYIGFIEYNSAEGKYEFVKRNIRILQNEPSIKTYGDVAFIDTLCKDLYLDLVKYYGSVDATKIYTYAILRILTGDTNSNLDEEYANSYISELYPNVAISKNTVFDFIKLLGKNENINKEFLFNRQKDHDVLIFDGTTITCESDTALSEYGRNAKKTTRKQIVEIKIYDTVTKEPIYYETIPGNVVDKTAFISILSRFDTKNPIIIVDKGFNTQENINYLLTETDYNFIMPYNDNSKKIKSLMSNNEYTTAFKFNDKRVKGMKFVEDNKFLYIFNDPFIGAAQESKYIDNIVNNKKDCHVDNLNNKKNQFGTIAFISNLDIEPNLIYEYYKMRWEIEVNVRLEKSTLDNEVIRVHNTFSMLGIRFLIQIEMIMLSRIYFCLKDLDLLKTHSIRSILKQLNKVYKSFIKGKWITSINTKKTLALLASLNIPVGVN